MKNVILIILLLTITSISYAHITNDTNSGCDNKDKPVRHHC